MTLWCSPLTNWISDSKCGVNFPIALWAFPVERMFGRMTRCDGDTNPNGPIKFRWFWREPLSITSIGAMRTRINCQPRSDNGLTITWIAKILRWISWWRMWRRNRRLKWCHAKSSNVPSVRTPKCCRPIWIIWLNDRNVLIDFRKFTARCHWKRSNFVPIRFCSKIISQRNSNDSMMLVVFRCKFFVSYLICVVRRSGVETVGGSCINIRMTYEMYQYVLCMSHVVEGFGCHNKIVELCFHRSKKYQMFIYSLYQYTFQEEKQYSLLHLVAGVCISRVRDCLLLQFHSHLNACSSW